MSELDELINYWYGNRKSPQRGAFKKGYFAAQSGDERNTCPYHDWRTDNGRESVTFSRSFIRAWLNGWDNYK
jgi:ribosome modulation factor